MVTIQEKNEVDERDGILLSIKYRESKKLFWSDVNMNRKERNQLSMKVRDNDGNIVTGASDVKQRWKEYFEWLLNVDDGRRAELTEDGLGVMHELAIGELEISVEHVRKVAKKLQGGKSPRVDEITSEIMKCADECLLE